MATNDKGLTPMMRQFFSMKEKHPEALLLFRCGDFYETYCDDAVEAARILGITLTRRNNGAASGAEMAGFPHHALDTYLPKLIRAGKRVAICDQLEDPKKKRAAIKGKKGLSEMDKMVKRGITELVTPGVAMGDNVLNYKENNFLAAIHFGKGACGVSLLDISTGEFLTGEGNYDYVEKLLGNFQPKEVLYDRTRKQDFEQQFGTKFVTFELDDWVFTDQTARQKLLKHFKTKNLKGFGVDHLRNGIVAAGAIMQYLELTQHTHISHITSLRRIEEDRYVRLDRFTIRSLELLQPMQEEGTSLLDVIDHTVTPMGGRMIRRWTVFPLRDVRQINERLDGVEYFYRDTDFRETVDDEFHRIGDLERIISKAAVGRISPREVNQLRHALAATVPVKTACLESDNEAMRRVGERLNLCETLRKRIEQEIQPDPPLQINKGGVIAAGFSPELDDLRSIRDNGKEYLLQIQQREMEKTGISSLKIGFNNVFGYYLEVRNTFKDRVPAEWVRKQTLAQAERYITEELKEYEEKILGADEKIIALETSLFMQLVEDMREYIPQIQINANVIAHLDCLLSFAKVAEEQGYVRPVVDESDVLDISQGRHAVIETQLPVGERYVPNDVYLDTERQQIVMITGPNMSGKSALLRQTALIAIMAQMGCFVPAERARIGLVDKVFTRVGASDSLSTGESTFMVEMTEAANILNNVTPRSLVLFDELGRGTSTYDGISIAWAIVEYLHEHKRAQARTLFATHYHELTCLEGQIPGVKNYNVAAKKRKDDVIFLRKIVPGPADQSYGIEVAGLAGVPSRVIDRARDILSELEAEGYPAPAPAAPAADSGQVSFLDMGASEVADRLRQVDIDTLTPIEAMNLLYELKKKL